MLPTRCDMCLQRIAKCYCAQKADKERREAAAAAAAEREAAAAAEATWQAQAAEAAAAEAAAAEAAWQASVRAEAARAAAAAAADWVEEMAFDQWLSQGGEAWSTEGWIRGMRRNGARDRRLGV